MDISQLVITPFSLLLIFFGFLKLNDKFNEKEIKRANSLKGIKSEITKDTLKAQKMIGWFMILLGISMILFIFIYLPSLNLS